MNQIISRGQTNWSIDTSVLQKEEILLNWEIVENFYVYSANLLLENTIKKGKPNDSFLNILGELISTIKAFSCYLLINLEDKFVELLFRRVSKEEKVEVQEEGRLILIDDNPFVGDLFHLPIIHKLFISSVDLFWKENFTFLAKGSEGKSPSWLMNKNNDVINKNRRNIVDFVLNLYLFEVKCFPEYASSCLNYIQKTKQGILVRELLLEFVTNYSDNGILPYSAYYFQMK